MYKKINVRIKGLTPLMIHSCRLANPLDPLTRKMKEITAKKTNKTDSDIEELSRLEFTGGFYVDENERPVIPGENIEGMLRDGGKKTRKGKQFTAGLLSDGLWPIIYDGPATPNELWEHPRFVDVRPVKVRQATIMRTRPIFNDWALEFSLSYLPDVLNKKDIESALNTAAVTIGLGDFRPKFGKFLVEKFK